MKNDYDIKEGLINQIELNPLLETTIINADVQNGVVTLFGSVENYFEKLTAEKTAKNVEGVIKVVNNINVCISRGYETSDLDIVKSVVKALRLYTFLSPDKIKIKAKGGVITLYGEVEDDFQREIVDLVIAALPGVIGICNFIKTRSTTLRQVINKKNSVEYKTTG